MSTPLEIREYFLELVGSTMLLDDEYRKYLLSRADDITDDQAREIIENIIRHEQAYFRDCQSQSHSDEEERERDIVRAEVEGLFATI